MAEASFFPRAEPLSVADIAALARIDLPHGACGTATISGAAPLETAGPDDLVYMDNAKYAEVLGSTRAGACLVSKRFAGRVPAGTVALVTPQPYEALLHKASANVGVATADLYPKLVVSGGFSSSQLSISDVFGSGINVWNIALNLLQPIFRGGELQARKRAAEAAYEQALAGYRQTVLQGLQNVADVLRALEGDANAVEARSMQVGHANETHRITLEMFRAGGVSELAVLDDERQRRLAEVELLNAQSSRLTDAAALFQALGGSWSK